jgi:3-deoxy-D-manno-octulosonic-acid transferase
LEFLFQVPPLMRLFYSLLLYFLLPGVLLRLWWKGRHLPGYRRHWKERLAWNLPSRQVSVWLHAVSVGEVRAAQSLIQALLDRHPDKPLLVTVTTPAGRQTVQQLFGDRVDCYYLPYDLPGAVRRFLSAFNPILAIVMEVELWPNLYAALATRGVPLYLVNARLSQRSLRGYQRLGGLMPHTLRHVRHIAAQTETDKARFSQLGVKPEKISVTGNLKFDAQLPADFDSRVEQMRQSLAGHQPVWLAASTHAGEESLLLRTHTALLQRYPQALLILAPRHSERTAAIAQQCAAEGLSFRLLSESASEQQEQNVLLIDRLGVLVYCYGVADAAFVGGSLIDKGGHNPVEALLAGTPVISGPHVENFVDFYAQLQAVGAAFIVNGGTGLSMRLLDWLNDRRLRDQAVAAGQAVVRENRGALDRVLRIIDRY